MRISLLGLSCSGKTTIGNILSKKYIIPVYHLDEYYWEKPWIKNINFDISNFLTNENWIIEGNYFDEKFKERLISSDVIVYINIPLIFRVYRMVKRHILFLFKPTGKNPISEKINLKFLILTINKHFFHQKKIKKYLLQNYGDKMIYIHNSLKIKNKEIEFFEKNFYKFFNS